MSSNIDSNNEELDRNEEAADDVNIKSSQDKNENVATSKTKVVRDEMAVGQTKTRIILTEMEDREHPVITAKKKNMNLSSQVVAEADPSHPQVNEARATHDMPVKSNDRVNNKPYESIIYGKNTMGCLGPIRAFVSKSGKSKQPKASIPDTWGQDRTERSIVARKESNLLESTSRDHPYTPVKHKNHHVKQNSKRVNNEAAKSRVSSASERYSVQETRVHPLEEFEALNKKLGKSKVREDEKRTSGGSEKIRVPDADDGEHRARTVSFYEDESGKHSTVIEPSVPESGQDEGSIAQRRSDDERIPQRVVSSMKVGIEPKAGSSKSPDVVVAVPSVKTSPDSSDNPAAAIGVTELTKKSEISEVGSSDSDDSDQVDPSIFKIEDFSQRYSGDSSPRDSRAKSVTCTQLEELEEKLRNLSGRIAPLVDEKKSIEKEDGASVSIRELKSLEVPDEIVAEENAASVSSEPELTASKVDENAEEQLPESDDWSCCRGRSFDEFPEISSHNPNAATSISSSVVSFDDGALPSYLPTFPTPVPEKMTSLLNGTTSQIRTEPSEASASKEEDDDDVEERQTASAVRMEEDSSPDSGNRSDVTFPMNSSKEYVRIPCDTIRQLLRTLNTLFVHFVIPRSSIRLYVANSEHPKPHLALGDLAFAITDQILGKFGSNLLTVIRNPFRNFVTNEVDDNEVACSKGYERVFNAHNYGHMTPLMDPLMEKLIDPMMRMVEYNPWNMFSRLNNSCEIIFPNPAYSADDHRLRLITFFEQVIPLAETMWNEAVRLLVSSYKELKNSFCDISQTPREPRCPVFRVPERSDVTSVNHDESQSMLPIIEEKTADPRKFEADDGILAIVTLDVLGIMFPSELTKLLLHPTNALENMVDERCGRLRHYDFANSMLHRVAVCNPTLVFLLGQELLNQSDLLYVAMNNGTSFPTRGVNACDNFVYRNHLMDEIIARNIRPASDSTVVITNVAERLSNFIEI